VDRVADHSGDQAGARADEAARPAEILRALRQAANPDQVAALVVALHAARRSPARDTGRGAAERHADSLAAESPSAASDVRLEAA
jgi:hypothetical protein